MANYKLKHHAIFTDENEKRYPANTVMAGATLNGKQTKEYMVLELCDAGGVVTDTTDIKIEPMTTISGLSEV